jgi:hypothetical protein
MTHFAFVCVFFITLFAPTIIAYLHAPFLLAVAWARERFTAGVPGQASLSWLASAVDS